MKLIKDHHKEPIVQVKFCDQSKEKPHLNKGVDHTCKECANVGSWMILSIDQSGKVVQNLLQNLAFGAMYANEIVFVDPSKSDLEDSPYQVACPRMSSRDKP